MSYQFQASGGTPPYLWAAISTLPPGLTLSSDGILSGIPTSSASGNYTISVTDSLSVSTFIQIKIDVIAVADPVPVFVEQIDFFSSVLFNVELIVSDLLSVVFDISVLLSFDFVDSASMVAGTGLLPSVVLSAITTENTNEMPARLAYSFDFLDTTINAFNSIIFSADIGLPIQRFSTSIVSLIGISGLTLLHSTAADDTFFNLPNIGFDFDLYGVLYRTNIFVGSNSYVTFGFSTNAYSSLDANNPVGPKLLIGGADRSWNQLYGGQFNPTNGGLAYRIHWKGNSGTSGSGTVLWEVTLFSNGVIMLVVGNPMFTDGRSCLSNGTFSSPITTNYSIAVNTSYVFIPDGSGSYTVQTGSYS